MELSRQRSMISYQRVRAVEMCWHCPEASTTVAYRNFGIKVRGAGWFFYYRAIVQSLWAG